MAPIRIPHWPFGIFSGLPEERRFLGGIKVREDDGIPLAAYRCPGCGYVQFYARPG